MNNGYTSIVIDGETLGLKFGMPANRIFMEYVALNADRIANGSYNETDIGNLIYAGYINNCMIKDEEPRYKLGFFIGFVDDNLYDDEQKGEFERIARVYEESKQTKKMIEAITNVADDLKKKLTGMPSNQNAMNGDLPLENTSDLHLESSALSGTVEIRQT